MYENYWRLSAKPFEEPGELGSYYPTETHQGALLKLRYAIEARRPAAVLAGSGGTGKTLLVQMLGRQLAETFRPLLHLVYPQLTPAELIAYLADGLTGAWTTEGTPLSATLRRLETALRDNVARGQHALLVVDEAHLLADSPLLETLRLVLNFTVAGQVPLTLLLVGQPALLAALERQGDLEARIAVKCLLRPLHLEETVSYVNHRLAAVGGSGSLFDGGALEAVFAHSQGYPRLINRLCDLALLIGFAEDRGTIGAAQIEAIASELVSVAPE